MNRHRALCYRTGGGSPPSPLDLSEGEKRIIEVVGQDAIDGDPEILEIGVANPPDYRGLKLAQQADTQQRVMPSGSQVANNESSFLIDLTDDGGERTKKTPKKTICSRQEEENKSFDLQQSVIDALNSVSDKVDVAIALENRQILQNSQMLDCLKVIKSNIDLKNKE